MGALTKHQPKPMIRVGNMPLIDHCLALTQKAGILTTVVNSHYLPDNLEQHLAGFEGVKIIRETPDILETGGGLKNALPYLGNGPVFTLNSDMIWTGGNPLIALQRAWQPQKMDALMVLVETGQAKEHSGTGDFFMDATGCLTRRGSRTSAPYVYTGAQIIKTDRLLEIGEIKFSLNLLWDKMLADGRVYGLEHKGGWVDVGRPEAIATAEAELARAKHV